MKEKFILFKFQEMSYIVGYICNKEDVNRNEIENATMSYLASDIYDEDSTDEEIISDVMSSFSGVEFKFIDFAEISV